MLVAANTNTPAASAGGAYYPEMGERHDGTALFERHVGYGGYCLKWSADRHQEALDTFKKLRIRPRYMEPFRSNKTGITKWSAGVTWEAGRKLDKVSVTELLLD